jgi:hypothetical protein
MGFTRERAGAGGIVRYAATYRDLKGRQRSAGVVAQGSRGKGENKRRYIYSGEHERDPLFQAGKRPVFCPD